jgi:hypothetical protein
MALVLGFQQFWAEEPPIHSYNFYTVRSVADSLHIGRLPDMDTAAGTFLFY